MENRSLTIAFVTLLALSIGTAALTDILPQAGTIFVVVVLTLSGVKARIILTEYLGLRHAPEFRRGFTAFLVAFLLAAFGLYMLG